jgi:hypothetical protein
VKEFLLQESNGWMEKEVPASQVDSMVTAEVQERDFVTKGAVKDTAP